MLSNEQLLSVHRVGSIAAGRVFFSEDERLVAGLRAVETAVRADQIEKDAGIVEANAGARTARQAFLIRAQLEGTTDE